MKNIIIKSVFILLKNYLIMTSSEIAFIDFRNSWSFVLVKVS